ncbi:hypothetical protein ID866_6532 [Astraeus odoratus]|nr:hypothetical protein ID866_6532 [Astraeus odoratus]
MNELAHTVLCHCMSNDVLHWASAKVSRRLTKLGDSAPAWLSEAVLETCTGIRTLLDERWKQVQEADAISPPWDPCTLDFSADTKLSLSNSSEYISNALIPIGDCPPSLPAFEPKARLRGRLDDFLSKDGGFFQDAYRAEPHLALYDVEREVSRGIDAWVDHALTDDVACEKLELLMANYSLAARNTYGKNPEDLSRMLLTMIDLWVALDKLVVDRIPILAEYFPEILVSNLERLLMRDVRDLQRLLCAVKYIRHRHSNAIAGQSVFSDHVDSSSFATGCQEGLSIHESIAFGHLRSEPSLQWFNILREIRVNTLTFRHKEVHLLVAQAALQVGPVSETEVYVWHEELGNLSFCSSILRELENLVSTIQGNWLEAMTMNTISVLVARVLAAGIDDIGVTRQARQLLFMICKETFAWVVDIANSLENITGKIKKEACRARLRDMAAICRSAFDVGLDDAKEMLGYPEALGMFLTCAVIVRQNTPTSLDILDEMSRLLLERDRRLSWKLERVTSSLVLSGNKGIDFAVKRVYPTYNGAAHWHRGVSEHCSWFISHYSGCEATRLPKITFDIIDGTLLLDRKSEVNLPQWVKEDSVFGLIFGDRDLDVMLSDVAGMEYASHDLISGHRVYFRTVDRKLVIRAREQRLSDFLELVPPQKLEYDLPAVLIEKHAHWLNLSTKTIEVRPLEKLWQSSEDNWRIHFAPGSHCAQKGHTRLFDIRSPTWDMVARLLAPMDAARNLVITQDDSTGNLRLMSPKAWYTTKISVLEHCSDS